MRAGRLVLVVVLGGTLAGAAVARACSLDGVPSLTVNGRLVALNTASAATGSAATWAPFIAQGVYRASYSLLMHEDRAKVAAALPSNAFVVPWRWRFGDGATARGTTVHHIYKHPGIYVITVQAYFVAGTRQHWITFDKAAIHVR